MGVRTSARPLALLEKGRGLGRGRERNGQGVGAPHARPRSLRPSFPQAHARKVLSLFTWLIHSALRLVCTDRRGWSSEPRRGADCGPPTRGEEEATAGGGVGILSVTQGKGEEDGSCPCLCCVDAYGRAWRVCERREKEKRQWRKRRARAERERARGEAEGGPPLFSPLLADTRADRLSSNPRYAFRAT